VKRLPVVTVRGVSATKVVRYVDVDSTRHFAKSNRRCSSLRCLRLYGRKMKALIALPELS